LRASASSRRMARTVNRVPSFNVSLARNVANPSSRTQSMMCHARVMSVLPLKADIRQEWQVRYVPEAVTPGTRTSHERTGSDLTFFRPDACSGDGRVSVGR
jgi:hypothetical protein